MTTLKQRLMEWLGYQLVEENWVVPVMRDGRIVRFEETGYVRTNPFTEHALGPINIGYRVNPFSITARLLDSNDVQVSGSVGYLFNPTKANIKVQSQLARSVSASDQPLRDLLRAAIAPTIREFVESKVLPELIVGQVNRQLATYLRTTLKALLRPYGIQLAELEDNETLLGVSSVTIQQIQLPSWWTSSFSMSKYAEHMAAVLNLSPELLSVLLFDLKKVEQASLNGNLVYMTAESAMNPQLLQLLQQFKLRLTANGNGRSEEVGHRHYTQPLISTTR